MLKNCSCRTVLPAHQHVQHVSTTGMPSRTHPFSAAATPFAVEPKVRGTSKSVCEVSCYSGSLLGRAGAISWTCNYMPPHRLVSSHWLQNTSLHCVKPTMHGLLNIIPLLLRYTACPDEGKETARSNSQSHSL